MIALIRIVVQLLSDVCRFAVLLLRPSGALAAENLFLRRQLALYQERGMKPHRVDAAMRIGLTLLSRLFDWRAALVVVRPETLIRWHRARGSGYCGVSGRVWGVRRFHWNFAS